MTGANRWLWGAVAVLALAVAGVFGYKLLWPLLNPEVVAEAPLDPDCRLQEGACTASLPEGGSLTFAIRPRPVYAMQDLKLEARPEGLEVYGMEVDFSGVDMNMGFNRFPLEREGSKRFTGSAVLPVCIRDRMAWDVTVYVRTRRGRMAFPFRLETIAPNRSE